MEYNDEIIKKKKELLKFFSESKNYIKVIETAKSVLYLDYSDYTAHSYIVYANANIQNNYEKIIEVTNEALKFAITDKNRAYLYSILADANVSAGSYKQAIDFFQTSINFGYDKASLFSDYGYALACIGELEKGEQYIKKALDMDLSDSTVLHKAFKFYSIYKSNYEILDDIIKLLVKHTDEPFTTNVTIGNYYYYKDDYKEAYNYFKQAVLLDPSNEGTINMCKHLEQEEKNRIILDRYRTMITKDERDLYYSLLNKNKIDRIIKSFINKPYIDFIYYYSAYYYNKINKYTTAIFFALKSYESEFKFLSAVELSIAYFSIGFFKLANNYAKYCVEIDIKFMDSTNIYIKTLADLGNIEKSLKTIDYIRSTENVSAKFIRTSFYVYNKFLSNEEKEKELLNILYSLEKPTETDYYFLKATFYFKYNKYTEALESITKQLEIIYHKDYKRFKIEIIKKMKGKKDI